MWLLQDMGRTQWIWDWGSVRGLCTAQAGFELTLYPRQAFRSLGSLGLPGTCEPSASAC